MIFVKNSVGGREVNMINTVSKINLSKIGGKGGGSTSIWIMYLNIRFFVEFPLCPEYLDPHFFINFFEYKNFLTENLEV